MEKHIISKEEIERYNRMYYDIKMYIQSTGQIYVMSKEIWAEHYPWWETYFKNKKLIFSWHSCSSGITYNKKTMPEYFMIPEYPEEKLLFKQDYKDLKKLHEDIINNNWDMKNKIIMEEINNEKD